MNNIFSYLIIFLISLVVGMVAGIIFRSKDKQHGPNAEKEIQKKFYSQKLGKCIRFDIQLLDCPKS